VKKNALVVGSGGWATKVSGRLKEIFELDIQQISARSLLKNELEDRHDAKFHLLVCATRPELQEKVIANYSKLSNRIWLEKPVAGTFQGAITTLSLLENQNNTRSLVNFSWIFSEIWRSFNSLKLSPEYVARIQISRTANAEIHSYMSSTEDYGSHDIALIMSWILDWQEKEIEINDRKFDSHTFNAKVNGVPITWGIDFGVGTKSMIWVISWKDGRSTKIDFYGNRIIHNDEIFDVKNSENIENFVRALNDEDADIQSSNHLLALKTKEFFSI
jgi:hypothetical protein